jgi:hypothetical protein
MSKDDGATKNASAPTAEHLNLKVKSQVLIYGNMYRMVKKFSLRLNQLLN